MVIVRLQLIRTVTVRICLHVDVSSSSARSRCGPIEHFLKRERRELQLYTRDDGKVSVRPKIQPAFVGSADTSIRPQCVRCGRSEARGGGPAGSYRPEARAGAATSIRTIYCGQRPAAAVHRAHSGARIFPPTHVDTVLQVLPRETTRPRI